MVKVLFASQAVCFLPLQCLIGQREPWGQEGKSCRLTAWQAVGSEEHLYFVPMGGGIQRK